MTVDLHPEDANLLLPSDDFRPHMRMSFHILGNQFLVVHEG